MSNEELLLIVFFCRLGELGVVPTVVTKVTVEEGGVKVIKGCFEDEGALKFMRLEFPQCTEEPILVIPFVNPDGQSVCFQLQPKQMNFFGRST